MKLASLLLLLSLPIISEAGKRAVGLSVLNQQGLSLWRGHQAERTWWGTEVDIEAARSNVTIDHFGRGAYVLDDDHGYVYDTLGTLVNEYTIRFRTALTRKRIASPEKVSRVSYQSGYAGFSHTRWDTGIHIATGWYGGVEIGLGVMWKPLKKLSVSLRQGLALEFRYRNRDRSFLAQEGEQYFVVVEEIVTTKTLTISVLKPRLLVIVDL